MSRKWRYFLITGKGSERTIVFNNPPVNALSSPMLAELQFILQEYRDRRDVELITLAGNKRRGLGFSAGADIQELKSIVDEPDENVRRARACAFSRAGQRIVRQIFDMDPIIVRAQLSGTVVGGGLAIALACRERYVLAEDRDSFKWGFPEVTLGLTPGWGGAVFLPRRLDVAREQKIPIARDLISSGLVSKYPSAQAFGIVSGEEMSATGDEPAKKTVAPYASHRVVVYFAGSNNPTWDRLVMKNDFQYEEELFVTMMCYPDAREGITAFLEEREPKFFES